MPRSNRPRRPPGSGDSRGRGGRRGAPSGPPKDLATSLAGMQRFETHHDGDWIVRHVPGASAAKAYLCPGCRQEIPAGTGHVVAWSADPLGAFGDVGDRRHWHTGCWQARARRS